MRGTEQELGFAFQDASVSRSIGSAEAAITSRIYRYGAGIIVSNEFLRAQSQSEFTFRPYFRSISEQYGFCYKIEKSSEEIFLFINDDLIDHLSNIYIYGWGNEKTELLNFERRSKFIQEEILTRLFNGLETITLLRSDAIDASRLLPMSSIGLSVEIGGRSFPLKIDYPCDSNTVFDIAHKVPGETHIWQQLPVQAIPRFLCEMPVSSLSQLQAGAAIVLQTISNGVIKLGLEIDGFEIIDCQLNQADGDQYRISVNEHPRLKEKRNLADENMDQAEPHQTDATPDIVSSNQSPEIGTIAELPVNVIVELGSHSMTLAQVSELTAGSLLEFDIDLQAALPIRVNGHVAGKGQLVRINDKLAIQLTHWNR